MEAVKSFSGKSFADWTMVNIFRYWGRGNTDCTGMSDFIFGRHYETEVWWWRFLMTFLVLAMVSKMTHTELTMVRW